MFLGHFIVKNAKNDPRTLFERPKSDKFKKKRKNADIAGNSVKSGRFRPLERQNSGIFHDIYLKFCTRLHPRELFHLYSVFRKFEIFPEFFENNVFLLIIFYKFQNFENFETPR